MFAFRGEGNRYQRRDLGHPLIPKPYAENWMGVQTPFYRFQNRIVGFGTRVQIHFCSGFEAG